MNSIAKLPLSKGARIILYADDILLYKPVNSTEDIADLQCDVDKIFEWIRCQGLSPNYAKTQLLPVSRSRCKFPISLTLNGHPIPSCDTVKYLGVTLSSSFSWADHIQSTCKAARRKLGLVHRTFHMAPPQVRHTIYRSAILPKLDYCSAVWDPHQECHKTELEKVQKFAGRIITGQWKSTYSSLLTRLNWHPLHVRRRHQKLKVCLNNLSIISSSVFTPHPHPSARIHHSKPIFKPFVRTHAHRHSFFIDIISIWNSLPDFIVTSLSPDIFKRRLKAYFA